MYKLIQSCFSSSWRAQQKSNTSFKEVEVDQPQFLGTKEANIIVLNKVGPFGDRPKNLWVWGRRLTLYHSVGSRTVGLLDSQRTNFSKEFEIAIIVDKKEGRAGGRRGILAAWVLHHTLCSREGLRGRSHWVSTVLETPEIMTISPLHGLHFEASRWIFRRGLNVFTD